MSNSTIESKAQSQVSEKQDLMSDMDSVDLVNEGSEPQKYNIKRKNLKEKKSLIPIFLA